MAGEYFVFLVLSVAVIHVCARVALQSDSALHLRLRVETEPIRGGVAVPCMLCGRRSVLEDCEGVKTER